MEIRSATTGPAAFARHALTAATRARQSTQSEEHLLEIGGARVCLQFVGNTLQPIVLPALEHRRCVAAGQPDLTIELVDGKAAGEALALPGDATGEAVWQFEDETFALLAQPASGALHLLDRPRARALCWVNDATRLPWYEAGFPLRLIFHLWTRKRKQTLVHAGALGNERGALLIVGRGGSGKTTAALAGHAAGLDYLGDDYALISAEGGPRVWSLYCSAKLTPDGLRRFPELAGQGAPASSQERDKALVFLRGTNRGAYPLRAVLWPRLAHQPETRLVAAPPARLLLALAPQHAAANPGSGGGGIRPARAIAAAGAHLHP